MSKINSLISKASESSFYLWMLNVVFSRAVPFNAPHGFKIIAIKPGSTEVLLPYRKSNLNHVKGIHACALATLCEYTSGITLVSMFSEKDYRIILKLLHIDYHYQARMDVVAEFSVSKEFISQNVLQPLTKEEAVFLNLEIKVHDTDQNHICTCLANWQVKKWNKVKIK